jgi:riboflavin synthase
MFTGIIEHRGTIESIDVGPEGGRVAVHAPTLARALRVSKSISVNGCCLTITSVGKATFSADLSSETLRKTSFGPGPAAPRRGARVNLEQPLRAGQELGGHFVLGHVDATGRVAGLVQEGESWWYAIDVPEEVARYVVPKGSITVDGISLTVARWDHRVAEIAVIPYTYEHTNICDRRPGDAVNLEADILGKYIDRHLAARGAATPQGLSVAQLIEQGF